MRKFAFIVFSLFICSAFLKKPDTPPDIFLAGGEIRSTPSYQKVLRFLKDPVALEKAKIDYLISRMRSSDYRFDRNGVFFSGKRGAAHLLWKYHNKSEKQIKTALDFIHVIATRSSSSGEFYKVHVSDYQVYPLGDLLLNELRRLEELLKSEPNKPIDK
jgi:hypothetical protein